MVRHLDRGELEAGLEEIQRSPGARGELKAIVVRPATDARESLQRCGVSAELGVHGDSWAKGCWMSLPDGRPHPDVQIAIMNARAIALIAQEEARWPLAGDNLFVDLDLSAANLPAGTRLAIGPALQSQSWRTALVLGLLLGLVAYGTYDMTNLATLRRWPLALALVDLSWGSLLTGLAALAGYGAVRWSGLGG